MIDPCYEAKIKKKLIEEGNEFKKMVANLPCEEKALLTVIGGCNSARIAVFYYPTIVVRVYNPKCEKNRIDVRPDIIRELISKKLIEKCDWSTESKSLSLTTLGKLALVQLAI